MSGSRARDKGPQLSVRWNRSVPLRLSVLRTDGEWAAYLCIPAGRAPSRGVSSGSAHVGRLLCERVRRAAGRGDSARASSRVCSGSSGAACSSCKGCEARYCFSRHSLGMQHSDDADNWLRLASRYTARTLWPHVILCIGPPCLPTESRKPCIRSRAAPSVIRRQAESR